MSKFLSWWKRLPLRTQGIVLSILPFGVVLLSAGFSYWGNRQRQAAEIDVTRKFAMVSGLNELLTATINAETGVRGFLLTNREEFLQPYRQAQSQLPRLIGDLKVLALAEPGEKPRIDKTARVQRMKVLVGEQLRLLAQLAQRKDESSEQLYRLLRSSKTAEDALREEVRGMRREESSLLSERLKEIRTVRARDYLAIYAVLLVGILGRFVSIWMFNVGIGRRVESCCENVRCLGRCETLPHPPSGKPDALGELEQEITRHHEERNDKPNDNCALSDTPISVSP